MKKLYTDYLFNKNILVAMKDESDSRYVFESLFTLASKYNIDIVQGKEYASLSILKYVASRIPDQVPAAFYKGFPETVRAMSSEELLFDQLLHYYDTYVCGNFDGDAAHSLFEGDFKRTAFKEATTVKQFKIVDEWEAHKLIIQYVNDLCLSSRPLSEGMYNLVKTALEDGVEITDIASRDTAIKLLLDLNNPKLARFINLSDTLKIVEQLVHNNYHLTGKDPRMSLKRLNLCNKDRKFISSLLDNMNYNSYQVALCFEKRNDWKGLLHHIHYKPKTSEGKLFVNKIRNLDENISVMSKFEKFMENGDVGSAVTVLANSKGSGSVLRNLNYLLSRCKNKLEVEKVVSKIQSNNPILLIQLITQYKNYVDDNSARTFTFTKNYKLKTHRETSQEVKSRCSHVSKSKRDMLVDALYDNLRNLYKNKLGKVYIDESMKNVAVPMQETTAETGYGILPKGTRIHIPEGKIIRAFTYWEKVNDIDLSSVGVTADGKQIEFSWRSMYNRQSQGVAFSGDQTRGYNGGSEFFDFDLNAIKKEYPTMKYIVVCNNVYSGIAFNKCNCKAGYMLRDTMSSGEIWEPKTIESSYTITGDSTYSYMFAIDLEKNDFVWLNMCKDSMSRVAGNSDFTFLAKYLNMTDVISVYTLFEMMAREIVNSKEEADVIVSDDENPVVITIQDNGLEVIKEQEIITSKDTEKILKYLNNN